MNLDEYRAKIDNIDDSMCELFEDRMHIATEIAEYKKKNDLPVLNRTREREIINRVTKNQSDELAGYTKILFTTLFDLSRSYQNRHMARESELARKIKNALENTPKELPKQATVACQGMEGAYSQIVADRLFARPSIMYMSSFRGVFQAVDKNLCKYGILPIENSLYGSVTEVYDLMKEYNFHIAKGVRLQVNHTLLALPNTDLSKITEIYSHEQALGQCSIFLGNLKNVKITVCENTASAAKLVADSGRHDIAAISSKSCAELYGLSVLKEDIQNSHNNHTRFICISKGLEIYPGANKTSLMLTLPHRPGALYNMMAKFSALGLNLTKIESRPIPGRDFEFMFYFDMEASIYTEEVITLLAELEGAPEQFVFLGSYSEI
ncbi:MAG: chorismate mutase [Clostridiales bacterium GWF2_38_85]|nr:MAG: chorismate mutase [Clostridiales bacterium GWF2_38_85]HBL85438.1 bifunctional chorismate mutase/prephenate dehydratase [Clostridiales bacterium]